MILVIIESNMSHDLALQGNYDSSQAFFILYLSLCTYVLMLLLNGPFFTIKLIIS